jgi:hypothetical protein
MPSLQIQTPPKLPTVIAFETDDPRAADTVVRVLEATGLAVVRVFPEDCEMRRVWIAEQMQRRYSFRQGMNLLVLEQLLELGPDTAAVRIAARLNTTGLRVAEAIDELLDATRDDRHAAGFALTNIPNDVEGADLEHLVAIGNAMSPKPSPSRKLFDVAALAGGGL